MQNHVFFLIELESYSMLLYLNMQYYYTHKISFCNNFNSYCILNQNSIIYFIIFCLGIQIAPMQIYIHVIT